MNEISGAQRIEKYYFKNSYSFHKSVPITTPLSEYLTVDLLSTEEVVLKKTVGLSETYNAVSNPN